MQHYTSIRVRSAAGSRRCDRAHQSPITAGLPNILVTQAAERPLNTTWHGRQAGRRGPREDSRYFRGLAVPLPPRVSAEQLFGWLFEGLYEWWMMPRVVDCASPPLCVLGYHPLRLPRPRRNFSGEAGNEISVSRLDRSTSRLRAASIACRSRS
jgi:hypothetical protein